MHGTHAILTIIVQYKCCAPNIMPTFTPLMHWYSTPSAIGFLSIAAEELIQTMNDASILIVDVYFLDLGGVCFRVRFHADNTVTKIHSETNAAVCA